MKVIATIGYSVLVFAGSLIGYFKAASTTSLVSGFAVVVLMLLFALAISKGRAVGSFGAILLTVLTLGFFVYRYFLSFSFMPPGFMVLASLALLVVLFQTDD